MDGALGGAEGYHDGQQGRQSQGNRSSTPAARMRAEITPTDQYWIHPVASFGTYRRSLDP